MTQSGRDYSWLPEHQHHAAFTLAHVDDLIERVGSVLFDYLKTEPLAIMEQSDGVMNHVTVWSAAPLPNAVSRLAADALNQMRAAIEHTLYAEVEHELGRDLTESEGRRVEMPAALTQPDFADWLKRNRRPDLPPLRDGSRLVRRMRDLQPYRRRQDAQQHPLRVLVEHTNLAKHRTPAVAALHLGAVHPDFDTPDLVIPTGPDRPVEAGDILASLPVGQRVPLNIWPRVAIRRPHTGTWPVLMTELGAVEDWVRTVAIPVLVVGRSDVDPLPPQLDPKITHHDVRAALAKAGSTSAHERSTRRVQAVTARIGLVETITLHPDQPGVEVVQAWVDSLGDDQVLERVAQMHAPAKVRDHVRTEAVVAAFIAETVQAQP